MLTQQRCRYTSRSVCSMIDGLSYRKLDYWCRRLLVTPSGRIADGPGSQRLWTVDDVARLRMIVAWREISSASGVDVSPIREMWDCLVRFPSLLDEPMVFVSPTGRVTARAVTPTGAFLMRSAWLPSDA